MPFIVTQYPSVPAPVFTGQGVKLSPTDLIQMANKRTEFRGKALDLPNELVMAVQELCQERRWHWRKQSIAFPTEPNVAVYDLSALNTFTGLTVERVCGGYVNRRWQGPKIFDGSGGYGDLTPIFETDVQEQFRESEETGQPGRYFMDGQDQFRLCPTPNGYYTVRVPAWVLPNATPMAETIPLIPGYLHQLLLKKLEAQIFRYTLGEGNAKYVAAKAEYDAALQRACKTIEFAEGRVREWTTQDEDAVQSS